MTRGVRSAPPPAGFFYNPDVELLVRWYQAAAYQPFFRAHAHIETKRREPWLYGEPHLSAMREAVRERYRLLPYIYTLAAEAAADGTPIMRPLWYEFEADGPTFAQEDCFMLGGAILVCPVVTAGQTSADVRLPGGSQQRWCGAHTRALDQPPPTLRSQLSHPHTHPSLPLPPCRYDAQTLRHVGDGGSAVQLPAPYERIPVLYRGGSVLPRKERLRRASAQMAADPLTLLVAPDREASDGSAVAFGELYLDDGSSHGYEDGELRWRALALSKGQLSCAAAPGRPRGAPDAPSRVRALGVAVERVVLLAVAKPPKRVSISLEGGAPVELSFTHDAVARVLVVRKPGVPISADWVLTVQ